MREWFLRPSGTPLRGRLLALAGLSLPLLLLLLVPRPALGAQQCWANFTGWRCTQSIPPPGSVCADHFIGGIYIYTQYVPVGECYWQCPPAPPPKQLKYLGGVDTITEAEAVSTITIIPLPWQLALPQFLVALDLVKFDCKNNVINQCKDHDVLAACKRKYPATETAAFGGVENVRYYEPWYQQVVNAIMAGLGMPSPLDIECDGDCHGYCYDYY